MVRTSNCSSSVMKVALPSCVSSRAIESIFSVVNNRLTKNLEVRLLLDMSDVHQIEQEGLTRLYDLTQLLKSSGAPKIIIRRPNRVIRDALVLSNTMNLFEVWEDV
jgi:anti-anti-sigma regulatory factor